MLEGDTRTFLEDKLELLAEICIVSGLRLVDREDDDMVRAETVPDLRIGVGKARGEKCERCWTWSESVGSIAEHPTICVRCAEVVMRLYPDMEE